LEAVGDFHYVLATRARRHVEQRRPRFQTTRVRQEELAARFFRAAEQGDLSGLEALLAHDVELTGDGGGKVPALARMLRGRSRVARTLINWFRQAARLPGASLRPSRSTAPRERSLSTHSSG
jgi:RNA polymerase sigma-70 factor (ECF subfamily)